MDKCPFCKEENCNPAYYNGETWNPGHLRPGYNRSPECYERQIAALKERLEAWRALAPELGKYDGDEKDFDVYLFDGILLKPLRDMEEI